VRSSVVPSQSLSSPSRTSAEGSTACTHLARPSVQTNRPSAHTPGSDAESSEQERNALSGHGQELRERGDLRHGLNDRPAALIGGALATLSHRSWGEHFKGGQGGGVARRGGCLAADAHVERERGSAHCQQDLTTAQYR
jgi:hypothetical protein